jgi:hypothetical protein
MERLIVIVLYKKNKTPLACPVSYYHFSKALDRVLR